MKIRTVGPDGRPVFLETGRGRAARKRSRCQIGGVVLETNLWLIIALLLLLLLQVVNLEEAKNLASPELRALLRTVGIAFIGAATIVMSLILFALQINISRLPHRTFLSLAQDGTMFVLFAGSYLAALLLAGLSLVETWRSEILVATALLLILVILRLFRGAFSRALALTKPERHIAHIVKQVREEGAQDSRKLTEIQRDAIAQLFTIQKLAVERHDLAVIRSALNGLVQLIQQQGERNGKQWAVWPNEDGQQSGMVSEVIARLDEWVAEEDQTIPWDAVVLGWNALVKLADVLVTETPPIEHQSAPNPLVGRVSEVVLDRIRDAMEMNHPLAIRQQVLTTIDHLLDSVRPGQAGSLGMPEKLANRMADLEPRGSEKTNGVEAKKWDERITDQLLLLLETSMLMPSPGTRAASMRATLSALGKQQKRVWKQHNSHIDEPQYLGRQWKTRLGDKLSRVSKRVLSDPVHYGMTRHDWQGLVAEVLRAVSDSLLDRHRNPVLADWRFDEVQRWLETSSPTSDAEDREAIIKLMNPVLKVGGMFGSWREEEAKVILKRVIQDEWPPWLWIWMIDLVDRALANDLQHERARFKEEIRLRWQKIKSDRHMDSESFKQEMVAKKESSPIIRNLYVI